MLILKGELHMEKNFGEQISVSQSKRGNAVLTVIGILIVAFFIFEGILSIILSFIDDEHSIMYSLMSIAIAAVLGIIFFILSKIFRPRIEVTLYEQGIIIQRGTNTNKFHFSEIKGILESSKAKYSDTAILVGFGLLGGLLSSLTSRKGGDNREVLILDNNNKKIKLADAPGQEISDIYTNWIVAEKNITRENISNLKLSFGDSLELSNGTFIHNRIRSNVELKLGDITKFESDQKIFSIFALNEKGKEKSLIKIDITDLLNVDLVTKIITLSKE